MSRNLNTKFGWKRILVEGNPGYISSLRKESPDAFSAVSPVCSNKSATFHYLARKGTGGIIEFMDTSHKRHFCKPCLKAERIPGDVWSTDWSKIPMMKEVHCTPMADILDAIHVKHVDFFILDVEVRS
jgi:hypothetical protein